MVPGLVWQKKKIQIVIVLCKSYKRSEHGVVNNSEVHRVLCWVDDPKLSTAIKNIQDIKRRAHVAKLSHSLSFNLPFILNTTDYHKSVRTCFVFLATHG